MKKLKLNLIRTGGGLFHDSRADSRLLAKVCNQIADKVDELIDKNEALEKEVKKLRETLNL